MQERDNNCQLLGICQKVCRFILNILLARGQGLGHAILQSPEPAGSSRVPDHEGQLMGTASSKIEIEFVQVGEMAMEKGGSAKRELPLVQENRFVNGVRARGLRTKDGIEERKRIADRERDLEEEKAVASGKKAEDLKLAHKAPRHAFPIFRSMANINEETDAFIRSRKEAMRRSYSIESKKH
ncbi:hypothetical protein Ancab_021926 [Ancistrocladus abbreviatus]